MSGYRTRNSIDFRLSFAQTLKRLWKSRPLFLRMSRAANQRKKNDLAWPAIPLRSARLRPGRKRCRNCGRKHVRQPGRQRPASTATPGAFGHWIEISSYCWVDLTLRARDTGNGGASPQSQLTNPVNRPQNKVRLQPLTPAGRFDCEHSGPAWRWPGSPAFVVRSSQKRSESLLRSHTSGPDRSPPLAIGE